MLGATVLWGVASGVVGANQRSALAKVDQAVVILRNHMEADMLHDTIRGDVLGALAAGAGAVEPGDFAQVFAQDAKDFRDHIAKTRAYPDSAEVRAAARAVEADVAAYLDAGAKLVREVEAGQRPSPREYTVFTERFERLEGGMSNISDKVEENVSAMRGAADFVSLLGLLVTLVCGGLILIVSVLVWRQIRSQIIAPVLSIRGALDALGRNELSLDVPYADRGDELGDLARAAETLRDRLSEAQAAREAQEKGIVTAFGSALERLAKGDLSAQIDSAVDGVFAGLRRDYNAAMGSLSQTLAMVLQANGATIGTASEISASVDDLSQRNERQSSQLQDMASAISGVAQGVGEAAGSVREAQDEMHAINSAVTQGGEVIHSAVQAMDRIEESSNRIVSIITTIDGISFQTNLLALNAGVEAARAGEAGKGFAVVATEVRALAQRSADAANEIKHLITLSGDEIRQGVALVREAGAALVAIVERMERISSTMRGISEGAQTQAQALNGIDGSAKELERITQANAALAEEVSAATRQVYIATQDVSQKLDAFNLGLAKSASDGFAGAAPRLVA
ncbi:methyl-accepting chemotaxis protein [Novosphingobium sp. 1949]|uniref:Methyl-accepting chemotaxis protein n=1 Tax=Novosphingobium organovorum TaxID=2930092 RepID=A0ABT0BES5_9SPHN|nr:methyl-accepting chemotaxis protein [Novosphingobium organovorum]MCJ2183286.1 methyl-accepting chemotaxis protein [Novosphingobium organovorum]